MQVVEAGSLSEAARRLGVSKSHVSKTLAALEDRLGARLLNRTTRRIALTDAGESFFERGQRILSELQQAEAAVSALEARPRGRFRITAPPSLGEPLFELLMEYAERFPEVELCVEFSERAVDLLDEACDLAIRVGRLQDSAQIARKLAPVRLLVVGSPSYVRAHGAPRAPEELSGHPCLLYSRHDGAWRFCAPDGAERRHSVRGRRVETNDAGLLVAAAERGLGLAQLPDFAVREALEAGRLLCLFEAGCEWGLYAVYPHRLHLSAKVRAFVDLAAERFGS